VSPNSYPSLGFDPAPGDLGQVAELADKYRVVGKDLAEANTSLRQIVEKKGVWTGQASDAFARRVGPLPEYLDAAARSMTMASGALDGWQRDLGELQRQAMELEARARKAAEVAERARNNPDFGLANRTFADQESLRLAQSLLDNAGRQLQEAIDGCTNLQDAAKKLFDQHTELAERVAELLGKAKELAPDEPGILGQMVDAFTGAVTDFANNVQDVMDDAWDFVQDHAELLSKVSDVVGDIGNVVGVVSDFLPPPAGEIAGAISAGLSLSALSGHVVAKAAGADVAPETLLFDTAGAASSIIGLIPGVPTTAVKVLGYGLITEQVGFEITGMATGKEFEGPIGDFKNYWVPKNGTQWAVAGSSIFVGPAPLAAMAFGNAAEAGNAADNAPERQRERKEDKAWS